MLSVTKDQAPRPKFVGSAAAIKFARRELKHLDAVLDLVPGRTACVQAGGNLGIFPKHLGKRFQTVYTFEPDPVCFQLLQMNAVAPNIIRLQAALGAQHGLVGTCGVRRDGKTNNHEGITHVVPNGVIPTLQIDDLQLPVCDLIYLDIEGGELDALRGAQETLRRCRPVLGVEINKNLRFVGVTEEQIMGFIHDRGYRFVRELGSDRAFVPVEWNS
jgi:FkbM family methyltransferase